MFKKSFYLFLVVLGFFFTLHTANSQSALEAGFEKLNQQNPISKSKSSGGGMDAALTEIELNEKAKKTQQAAQNIQTYSNDYNRQDKEMANKCACYVITSGCILSSYSGSRTASPEVERENRMYEANMTKICRAWDKDRSNNKANFLQQVNQLQANYQQTVKDYQETEKKLALEMEKKRQQYIANQQQEVLQQQQREKQKLLDREAEMKQLCQLKEHSGMCYCSSYVNSSGPSCGK